jgi:hypothetical protein
VKKEIGFERDDVQFLDIVGLFISVTSLVKIYIDKVHRPSKKKIQHLGIIPFVDNVPKVLEGSLSATSSSHGVFLG